MISMISDAGVLDITIVSETRTLWNIAGKLEGQRCPNILPFSILFPVSFSQGDEVYPLPPSYEAVFLGMPALLARCIYTLGTIITRARRFGPASWKSSKWWAVCPMLSPHELTQFCSSHILPLIYRPRSRARGPLTHISSLFSTIKLLPEEWFQVVSKMGVKEGSRLSPIECHVRISLILETLSS